MKKLKALEKQYFPKKCELTGITDKKIIGVKKILNNSLPIAFVT